MTFPIQGFSWRYVCLFIVSLVLPSEIAGAAIQTVPTSLNPGDQYRLVFVTSSISITNVETIVTYNNFVTSAASTVPALAALSTEWKVIGSTRFVNARENTGTDPTAVGPTGVPIFLLNDTRIASDYDDLWDGSLEQDLAINENGALQSGRVWTGSDDAGLGFSGRQLGAASFQAIGNSTPSNGSTTPGGANGWMFDDLAHATNSYSFYAMSSVLTVPGDPNVVPEATSFFVWGGLAVTAFVGKTSRRRRQD